MGHNSGVRATIALAAVAALFVAACGSDDDSASSGGDTTLTIAATTPSTGAPAVTGGWIDGEPEWGASEGRVGVPESDVESSEMAAAVDEDVAGDAGLSGHDVIVRPEPPLADTTPLRAGSVDDNADYQGFLEYLQRIRDLGIALRDLDATDRSVVTVTAADGASVAGVEVTITADDSSTIVRTTADGTARFLPGLYPAFTGVAGPYTASVGDATT
ncbi:MAG: hypothetical protein AAGG08_19730, partial [Actinomycetota bacterium]